MTVPRLWPLALAVMVGSLSACFVGPNPPPAGHDDAGITDDAGVGTDAGVDPCSVDNVCAPNATCEAVGGAAICTCKAGYAGDGTTCADIDECGTGTDTCADDATCTNTQGSFTCACNGGFTGDGFTCANVDECSAQAPVCGANTICTDTPGSFTCACNVGYVDDGSGACVDVDECGAGTDTCDANATCTNTQGSFTCDCNSGYSVDGTSCYAENSFTEGMVTITLDDGWATQFTGARPALKQRGIRSTYYLESEPIREHWTTYMHAADVQALIDEGNEVACHTKTHPDLTTLTAEQVESQLRDSQAFLKTRFGLSAVPAFAAPFGRYNDAILSTVKQYYTSHRTVEHGQNFRNTNIYKLRAYDVVSSVTVDTVRGWINQAKLDRTWLILLFHEFVSGTPTKSTEINIANFEAILDHVQASGLRTVTISEGVAMMDGVTTDPTGYSVVHEDALGNGFQDWSWATRNMDERGVVHSGVSSISFEPDYLGGLQFHRHHEALDASLYQSITLWVHGGTTGGQHISLSFKDSSYALIGSVRLDTVLGHPIQAGVWQQVTIPLSSVNLSTGFIEEIFIEDASSMDQGTVYLDEILLIRR
jgi:peptidoglycan/xylan/chitin deacetylase (PgdA/CDA1 family)